MTDLSTTCTTNRAFDATTYYTGFKVVRVRIGDSFFYVCHSLAGVLFSYPRVFLCLFATATTTVLQPFFRDHPGEPVPEENFFMSATAWCKRRLTEADTLTIQLVATPSGLTSAHLHHPPFLYRPDALPAAQPTVSNH